MAEHWADDTVLVTLQRSPEPLSMEEIGAAAGLAAADVAVAVKGLVSEGVLTRSGEMVAIAGDPDALPLDDVAGEAEETPAPPASTPAGLTVVDALGALPGELRFRAEVILVSGPDGGLSVESIVRVLSVETA